MKTALSLLIFIPLLSFSQIRIDFEDGQFSGWTESEPGHWKVSSENPINGNYSLKQDFDRPASGRDQISFPLRGLSLSSGATVWRFCVRHAYLPSSSNNWAFFLAADKDARDMKPGTNIEAFIAGVNFTGSDDLFKLWHLHDGNIETVISSSFNWQTNVGLAAAIIEIRRDASGHWSAAIDTSLSSPSFVSVGSGFSPDTLPACYFGISYEYSSSQDRKLWLDDISIDGIFIRDTLPPVFSDYRFTDSVSLSLSFSEPVDLTHAMFLVDHAIGTENSFIQPSPDSAILHFAKSFLEDTIYQLTLRHIMDIQGNLLRDSVHAVSFHLPRYQEVQINEIMADPSPPLGLPETEYIELYNATDHRIWLDQCIFIFGNKEKILPLFDMPSHAYRILCSTPNAPFLSVYGPVVPVPSMPSLTNGGMSLTLLDAHRHLLSHITYTPEWYHDSYKAEGGWSLEQIDPIHPCPRSENWKAAINYPGGTPGTSNSVLADNPDETPAEIINLFLVNDTSLIIRFSEAYNPATAAKPSFYEASHGKGHPISAITHPPDYLTVMLIFKKPFKPGLIYELSISEYLTDCSEYPVNASHCFRFARTVHPDSLDLIINEILYNPFPGGADFVEIFNRSDKVIDLHSILLAQRNDSDFTFMDICPVGEEPMLCFPKQYRIFTLSPGAVKNQYFTSDPVTFIGLKRMPSLPDDRGNIVLLDTNLHVLDEFHYNDDMQFALLQTTEGVSLERIHFSSPTQDPLNWHSASSDAGYATPGVQNSQYSDESPGKNLITTEPDIISPDNDGYHDVLHIHYHFDEPGYVATVIIYNANGRLVRTLANNILLGKQGEITWDGLNDEKKKPGKGIYLIYVKVFNLKGEIHGYKRTCVLAGQRE